MFSTRKYIFGFLLGLAGCSGGGGPEIVAPPVLDTFRVVTGQVTYWVTGPTFDTIDADKRLISARLIDSFFPAPAPHVPIEIRDDQGVLLTDITGGPSVTQTDDLGFFSMNVNFGKRDATQVILRTVARLDFAFGTKVRVKPSANQLEYSYQSPAPVGNPTALTMVADLSIPEAGRSGAWKICDSLYEGFTTAASGLVNTVMPDMDVYWEPGNGTVTSLDTSDPMFARLTVAGGILGDDDSPRDVWDDPVLTRWVGEYVLAYFIHMLKPNGPFIDGPMVPTYAWRAGFLDFWACRANKTAIYWDTEGQAPGGKVVRYYNVESFFDPALGSLGPEDPNVYQDPAVVGICSRFSIAETLWDIHDLEGFGTDGDALAFPFFLTLGFLQQPKAGTSYPYIVTLLDTYVRDNSLDPVTIEGLLRDGPENQNIPYPATVDNGSLWPVPFPHPTIVGAALSPPYDGTLQASIDTTAPDADLELSFDSASYKTVKIFLPARFIISHTGSSNLVIDMLDQRNNVLATGPSPLTVPNVQAATYVVRVRATTLGIAETFDIRLQLEVP